MIERRQIGWRPSDRYASPDCDPYGSLLHKIWSRLCEKDARSTCKAVYVLHRLMSAPACCGDTEFLALAGAYEELLRQRSAKTETSYFDKRALLRMSSQKDVGYDAKRWKKFVDKYFTFVDAAWRSVTFHGPATPGDASRLAGELSALATKAALALPDYPRRNDLVASVARRLSCDLQGYAAVLILSATAWAHPPDSESEPRPAEGS